MKYISSRVLPAEDEPDVAVGARTRVKTSRDTKKLVSFQLYWICRRSAAYLIGSSPPKPKKSVVMSDESSDEEKVSQRKAPGATKAKAQVHILSFTLEIHCIDYLFSLQSKYSSIDQLGDKKRGHRASRHGEDGSAGQLVR